MRIVLLTAVFFAAFQPVFAAKQSVAVLPSDGKDVLEDSQLKFFTDKAQEIAVKILPQNDFDVVQQNVIIKRLGGVDNYVKECKESSCIVELGRKVMVDYVAQCSFTKLSGSDFTVTFELYNVSTEGLIDKFTETAKNFDDLRAIMEKRIPEGFKKIPGARDPLISITDGIIVRPNEEKKFDDLEQRRIASIATEPTGAVLSFNGMPDPKCLKTPCNVERPEGDVRIIARLEQYEIADTTVFIKQNNQNVSIKLKPNFGVLEIIRAYLEGIGLNENWKLTINNKADSSWENRRLPPGEYKMKLSHSCYEDIDIDVGIIKGSHKIFQVKDYAKLKEVGLVLSAEKDGSPVSEPVFVNGKRVGETPFSDPVPLCSEIEIGPGKEKVNVKLEYNKTTRHVHKFNSKLTDSRDGKKYKIVKIGEQTWMAENLNYDADSSKCYENKPRNCEKYGRLYNWQTALEACPSGWHLPSESEYEELNKAVGGRSVAGKKLKANRDWVSGKSTDEFGFSALPGGYGNPDGSFSSVGSYGNWWTGNSYDGNDIFAYVQQMFRNEDAEWSYYLKSSLHSVRCLEGEPPPQVEIAEEDNDRAIPDDTPAIEPPAIEPPEEEYSYKPPDVTPVIEPPYEYDTYEPPPEPKKFSSLGFKAGFNSSHLYATYDNDYISGSGSYNSHYGGQIGLALDVALNEMFHIQSGLMYISKGTENYYVHYFEIPLLLSLKFSAFRINAGPYIDLCLGADHIADRTDFGFSTGFGYDINETFYIDVFYDYGLVDVSNKTYFEFYNRTLGLNFGINL